MSGSIITIKTGDFAGQQMHDLVALAKSLIGPGDLANGGQLTAQAASRLISMIFDDDFLSKVTTETMLRLTKDVDVVDIMRRQLVRVAQGNDPDSGAGARGRGRLCCRYPAHRPAGTISGLHAALHRQGVTRVTLTSPAAESAPGPIGAAYCTGITIEWRRDQPAAAQRHHHRMRHRGCDRPGHPCARR